MTATVVSLDSHRLNRPPPCGCARHLLEALTHRAVAELAGTVGEMLVTREVVEHLVADLLSTVEAALQSSHERTNP
jgi:hypothetical protein